MLRVMPGTYFSSTPAHGHRGLLLPVRHKPVSNAIADDNALSDHAGFVPFVRGPAIPQGHTGVLGTGAISCRSAQAWCGEEFLSIVPEENQ